MNHNTNIWYVTLKGIETYRLRSAGLEHANPKGRLYTKSFLYRHTLKLLYDRENSIHFHEYPGQLGQSAGFWHRWVCFTFYVDDVISFPILPEKGSELINIS